MHEMTAANLRSAFGGESMAHMRYLVWADRADRDGFANVGRLFRAIARAEQVHATGHFTAMKDVSGAHLVGAGGGFGLGHTSENLQGAIDGETFEVQEMYPAYLAAARLQEEKAAERSMTWALEAEKTHAALYAEAKKSVDAGQDPALGPVRVCTVCGHTVIGDAPDQCPICKARAEKYEAFE